MSTDRVPCTTAGCRNRAERYVSCENEGLFPYCGECAAILISGGESEHGAVDDPVVAERDRLAEALREAERLALGYHVGAVSARMKIAALARAALEGKP
jgi:hypothetical protein